MDRLLKAAKDGDVATLQYLIKEHHYDIETRGPWGRPYVS